MTWSQRGGSIVDGGVREDEKGIGNEGLVAMASERRWQHDKKGRGLFKPSASLFPSPKPKLAFGAGAEIYRDVSVFLTC